MLILIAGFGFAAGCAVGRDARARNFQQELCHGLLPWRERHAGGAPRLAARGFDDAYVAQTVRMGIPGTGMPAFGTTLERADMLAVIAYVDSLNGVTPPVNPMFARGPERIKLSPEAQHGRQLFADQVRAFAAMLDVPPGGWNRDCGRASVFLGSGKRGDAAEDCDAADPDGDCEGDSFPAVGF